jgi:hypothetical protein
VTAPAESICRKQLTVTGTSDPGNTIVVAATNTEINLNEATCVVSTVNRQFTIHGVFERFGHGDFPLMFDRLQIAHPGLHMH